MQYYKFLYYKFSDKYIKIANSCPTNVLQAFFSQFYAVSLSNLIILTDESLPLS